MTYPSEIVLPMKEELTENGFQDITTTSAVDNVFKKEGTTLVVINSVCGCAAGAARPGVLMAIHNTENRPDNLVTSFAGYDVEAVKQFRKHFLPYPPSSPAIALLKDGKVVSMVERYQIEGRPAQVIANHLISEFKKYCTVVSVAEAII
jgi:putative YphP/YqiW family bacilliredoxin